MLQLILMEISRFRNSGPREEYTFAFFFVFFFRAVLLFGLSVTKELVVTTFADLGRNVEHYLSLGIIG